MNHSRLRLFLLLILGTVHLGAHANIDAALAEVSVLIARHPDRPDLYLRRATYHTEHTDWRAAEADLRRAVALAPDHPGAAAAFARLYVATGRFALARTGLDAALARTPDDPELLILRARVLARLDDTPAACADYAKAASLLTAPSPGLYLEWSAQAPTDEQSLAVLEAGLARLGPAVVLLERTLELEAQLGRIDVALTRLDALMKSAERKEGWLKRRGDLLARAGRSAESRQAYHDALAAIATLPDWLRRSPSTAELANTLTHLTAFP